MRDAEQERRVAHYIESNPVKAGLVALAKEWPWSSARSFLEDAGIQKAQEIWREYPVLDYGKDWD